jgi:hypothetical protein
MERLRHSEARRVEAVEAKLAEERSRSLELEAALQAASEETLALTLTLNPKPWP